MEEIGMSLLDYPFDEPAVVVWQERHVVGFAVFTEGAWTHFTSERSLDDSSSAAHEGNAADERLKNCAEVGVSA
jgi:hypothetical protein